MEQSAERTRKQHSAERKEQRTERMKNRKVKFRFQDFEIWKLAIEIANELFDIADELENRKLYRFAEQLRAAGMVEVSKVHSAMRF
jgi:hypothetical protein